MAAMVMGVISTDVSSALGSAVGVCVERSRSVGLWDGCNVGSKVVGLPVGGAQMVGDELGSMVGPDVGAIVDSMTAELDQGRPPSMRISFSYTIRPSRKGMKAISSPCSNDTVKTVSPASRRLPRRRRTLSGSSSSSSMMTTKSDRGSVSGSIRSRMGNAGPPWCAKRYDVRGSVMSAKPGFASPSGNTTPSVLLEKKKPWSESTAISRSTSSSTVGVALGFVVGRADGVMDATCVGDADG
eukprot:scaffold6_cov245-Pinguiococcus_pyrenoidosus.AAC.3